MQRTIYLTIICNHYSIKTTYVQAKHKYATKANLCIRVLVQMLDHSVFR